MKLRPPKEPPTNPIEWSRWLRSQEISGGTTTTPAEPPIEGGELPQCDPEQTRRDRILHWFLQT